MARRKSANVSYLLANSVGEDRDNFGCSLARWVNDLREVCNDSNRVDDDNFGDTYVSIEIGHLFVDYSPNRGELRIILGHTPQL